MVFGCMVVSISTFILIISLFTYRMILCTICFVVSLLNKIGFLFQTTYDWRLGVNEIH